MGGHLGFGDSFAVLDPVAFVVRRSIKTEASQFALGDDVPTPAVLL
jgi:hypothetical protein